MTSRTLVRLLVMAGLAGVIGGAVAYMSKQRQDAPLRMVSCEVFDGYAGNFHRKGISVSTNDLNAQTVMVPVPVMSEAQAKLRELGILTMRFNSSQPPGYVDGNSYHVTLVFLDGRQKAIAHHSSGQMSARANTRMDEFWAWLSNVHAQFPPQINGLSCSHSNGCVNPGSP